MSMMCLQANVRNYYSMFDQVMTEREMQQRMDDFAARSQAMQHQAMHAMARPAPMGGMMPPPGMPPPGLRPHMGKICLHGALTCMHRGICLEHMKHGMSEDKHMLWVLHGTPLTLTE